jgi:rhodanese-related sulfurtransferase
MKRMGAWALMVAALSMPAAVVAVDYAEQSVVVADGTPEEAAAAAELGLDYENIPVSSAVVDPGQVTALAAALDGAPDDALVVVHCASGNRAAMLWSAVQVHGGRPLADVQAEVEGVLTSPRLIEGLTAYAGSLGAEGEN